MLTKRGALYFGGLSQVSFKFLLQFFLRYFGLWWVLVLGTPQIAYSADHPIQITYDSGHTHQFSGFGAQVWPETRYRDIRQQLFHQLNMRSARFGLGLPPVGDEMRPGVSAEELLTSLRTRYDSDSKLDSVRSLAHEIRALQIETHGIVWEMPPEWRVEKDEKGPGSAQHIAKFADTKHTQDFANYVAAEVMYAKRLGFPMRFVEITNEPNGSWNTRWRPPDYAVLVETTRQVFDRNGLADVGIEGPGTGTSASAGPFLDALDATGAAKSLAAYSIHEWDSRFMPDPEGLSDKLRSQLAGMRVKLPLHVTEFNDINPRWSQPPYVVGPSQRSSDPNSADTRAFGLALASSALKLIADGATEVMLWQMQDLSWGQGSFGLIDLQGQARPAVAALGIFLQLLPEPARVAAGDSTDPQLISAAFFLPDRTIIVTANLSDTLREIEATSLGLKEGDRILTIRNFAVPEPSAAGKASLQNGLLSIAAPANSLTAVIVGGI